MTYIYDVTLNFNEILYDFFEWNNNDNIIHVKKIPMFKINNIDFFNVITHKIRVNDILLNKIRNKTETYGKSGKSFTACLISNDENIIALKFNNEGISTDISSIIVEEELDILEIKVNNSKIFTFKQLLPRKYLTTTRFDNINKKFLKKEINNLDLNKDKDKIKYLYFEYFGKYIDDELIALNKLKQEINNEYNNNLKELFKLASNKN